MTGPAPAVIDRLADAFAKHDLDEAVACYRADALLDTSGLPGGARASRHREIREAYREIFSILPILSVSVRSERTSGPLTLREVVYEGHHPASESPLSLRASELFEVSEDLIASARLYLDAAEAAREFERLARERA